MRIRSVLATLCTGALLVGAGTADASPTATGARGTLVVAVDTGTPPYAFVGSDGQTVVGLDADLARALANAIGYRLRLVDAAPDAILAGIASGEFDVGMPVVETKATERGAELLGYLSTGTSFVVRAAGGPAVSGPGDLCGRPVAVARGTAQAAAAAARSTNCRTAGKRPLRIVPVGGPAAAETALTSGRAQVVLADSAVAASVVKQSHGRLELTGPASAKTVRALAVSKQNGMAAELQDALETVIGDGTYEAILARWGMKSAAIAVPRISAGTR